MAAASSFFSRFFSPILVLFFYLGCFVFPAASPSKLPRKKKTRITTFGARGRALLSSFNPWSYLRPIVAGVRKKTKTNSRSCTPGPAPAGQLVVGTPKSASSIRKRSSPVGSVADSDFEVETKAKRSPVGSFAVRTDVFPCSNCGEVFEAAQVLDLHRSTKHAISELFSGDSAMNIVAIIFQTGWGGGKLMGSNAAPRIRRVLKIHHSPKTLSRFEEYRESVKAKAAKRRGRWGERCIVDGNELLRFHCSTFLCSLGRDGICAGEFCSVCSIIRSGFSPKLDGIPMTPSSRRAHEAIPADMEQEFRYMNVKRAMLVCRVVAGRVAREDESCDVDNDGDKEDGEFDSVLVAGGGCRIGVEEEELLVYSPRAVLPCFVIVYGD